MNSLAKHGIDGGIRVGESLRGGKPQAEPSYLLEHSHNTVTNPTNEHGVKYEVAKCHCRCWFCPDCCSVMGYNLQAKLIPILGTFKGLVMITLTIDPELFPDPQTAYEYAMDERCVSITTQDLDRWKHLHTKRYFYVVEWQKNTEFAHFHVLYDSSFIPWEDLLKSWSKHRPKTASPVIGNRPAFGTVMFSAPKFANPVHAGRYATKYLIKTPEHGYPKWVLNMGDECRIRRYSTSRPFWNNKTKRNDNPQSTRKKTSKKYSEKLKSCGDSVNIFEIKSTTNKDTGEITNTPIWKAQLDISASDVINNLFDPGDERRNRRSLLASNMKDVKRILETVSGTKIETLRFRKDVQNE